MQGPHDLGRLKSAEWGQLQEVVERFEKACSDGDVADLERFLPLPGDPLRPVALQELIKTDLEIRWRHGRAVTLEVYLEKFPELGGADDIATDLIYEEYRVRQDHGDKPTLDSYQPRFPKQFPELAQKAKSSSSPLPTASTPEDRGKADTSDQATAAPSPSPAPSPPPVAHMPFNLGAVANSVLPVGGGYKMVRRIGSGSFGEVWRAEAPGGIEVAVKIIHRPLDHEAAQRELQSLELIKRLRHPYLVSTTAYWSLEDRLVIVMELADQSLRDRMKDCRASGMIGIAPKELMVYMRESAEALDFLNQEHVQHRDIKPDNILILHGHAKVADFGLARRVEHSQQASLAGTQLYMAPEVWRGKVSTTSDQYSLAATYCDLRMGHALFHNLDAVEVMLAHVQKKPELDALGTAEQEVLHQALAKDPAQRFTNCTEFVHALDKALAKDRKESEPEVNMNQSIALPTGQGPLTDPGSGALAARGGSRTILGDFSQAPGWRATGQRRSSRSLALLLGVLLGVAGGIGYVLYHHFSSPPTPLFTLEFPPGLTMRAGELKTIPITVKRDKYEGPVQITFENVPANVMWPAAKTIPEGSDSVRVEVAIAPDAATGTNKVAIRAETADPQPGGQQTGVIELGVEPSGLSLPVGWEKSSSAELVSVGDKVFYKQIDVPAGSKRVHFILIPKLPTDSPNDPGSFYIMRDKVSVGLFRQFADANPKIKNAKLCLDLEVQRESQKQKLNGNDRCPLLGVDVGTAYECVRWLAGKKGHLPTQAQWNKAAGLRGKDQKGGPYRGDWEGSKGKLKIAVHGEPEPMDDSTDDIAPTGCRFMAGNGEDWTRETIDALSPLVPVENPSLDISVITRGRSYREAPLRPLLYADLVGIPGSRPYLTEPKQAIDMVGFRAVIEP
jgi:serine/threonine protein kinase/formylglycine-generating enzyme required for sulfatase activity